MITVHLPANLANEFRVASVQQVEAKTLAEVIESLDSLYPGMGSWMVEPDGCFREHLSVFVGGRRLVPRAHASVPVERGSLVWILHAISGG